MTTPIRISAHGKGYTCLTFSSDGGRAFTGGRDCIVRIWKMDEGEAQEPEAATEADGAVTCLAATDETWLAGSEDTELRRYSGNTTQYLHPLTMMNGIAVRSVAIGPLGTKVAVSSEELTVKVINLEDVSKIHLLEGYKAGVRSASWNPSGTMLATCTADGKIVVWNMDTDQPTIAKTLEGIIPAVTDTESREYLYDCSVAWQRTGECFYVATRTHEIVQVNTSSWTKVGNFHDKNVTGAITALAISPNGLYLASASQSSVFIWSTKTRTLVTQQSGNLGAIITKVVFSPKENLLAWVDTEGAFTRWPKPISDKLPNPVKIPASTTASAPAAPAVDLFEQDADVALSEAIDELPDEGDPVDLDDNAWIDDDIGELDDKPRPRARDEFVKEMVNITKAQEAFQPGSTTGEKRRYLAYNTIGVIEVTENDMNNVVNVEVFDQSLRKGFHFSDPFKCNLGYLGERGVVFAFPSVGEQPAEVRFQSYSTWDKFEWSYKLRSKTQCLGIAAGALPLTSETHNLDNELQGYGHVVIATDEGDLTFLSGTGRPRRILGLGGEFVTMVASAEWVFVVYRPGATTIDGSQNLSYCMINFDDFTVRQRDVLPVPKGHTLKWVGITNHGAPTIYDSAGRLHILAKYRVPHHGSWARVLDTNLHDRRRGKDESYWPVGVVDDNFLCLILKGLQTQPGFPKPLIQELPLQMPFHQPHEKEEAIERELLQIELLLDTLDEELTTDAITAREKAMDKEFILLIQAACKVPNIPRAIELTKLLHYTVSMELVAKVADFYHLPGFKQKVNTIKADREEAEDRLIAARNKRRKWLKPTAAPRQVMGPPAGSARYDPLGDTRPPPVIERPGLARVVAPVIERTQYSSQASHNGNGNGRGGTPEGAGWDETLVDSPPSLENGKRKRTALDDDDSYASEAEPSSLPPPPTKQKANPFARKPANDTAKSNPFARRNDSIKLQKSDSFFDKVDSVDDKKRSQSSKKRGDKDLDSSSAKKTGEKGRQATLFSMMPSKSASAAPARKSKLSTCLDVDTETQTTDVTMADVDQEETQLVDETQRAGSPDWDETQLEDDESIAV